MNVIAEPGSARLSYSVSQEWGPALRLFSEGVFFEKSLWRCHQALVLFGQQDRRSWYCVEEPEWCRDLRISFLRDVLARWRDAISLIRSSNAGAGMRVRVVFSSFVELIWCASSMREMSRARGDPKLYSCC